MAEIRNQHIHKFLHSFFPEWGGMKHIKVLDHESSLPRLHVELLHALARKRHMDLFEIASLLDIGHVSAAEMIDTLIDKGLLETNSSSTESSLLRVRLTPKVAELREFGDDHFASLKEIVDRDRSRDPQYSLFSENNFRNHRKHA